MALQRLIKSLALLAVGVSTAVFSLRVYLRSPLDVELWVPIAAVSLISFVLLAVVNYKGARKTLADNEKDQE